ncbi:hypothetical protein HNQ05_000124 [Oceanithermus desulfurans]|uniref:Uncharacterized protein n=2 Tax=Oceanithermus desulfurans TaxID=227924 RepID=A0A511RGQ8_9DEIN|nr:hypothetical protein [Oceanithermus desulfurans]MBB6028774.1 hypothetical protein [Oceanithermus desulfurans]GEM88833.1 hypothetical protein ODE01S_02670 [Oceanithermus desulfurans NBRC 100063]
MRARAQHDEQVGGVVAGGRDQPLGALDARLPQGLVLGGVALEDDVALVHRPLHPFGVALDDHEGLARLAQLLGRLVADAAQAGEDHVFRQRRHFSLHLPLPPFAARPHLD